MARFYISSTFNDLVDHRAAVYDSLRRLDHDAVVMEHYVAGDARPLVKVRRDIDSCDAYIGIVAWRRGFIPTDNADGSSITELEYAYAVERGKKCLIFLLSPAAPWPNAERDPFPEQARLEAFRDSLQRQHVVSFFESPLQLALLVTISVRLWELESGQARPLRTLEEQIFPQEIRLVRFEKGEEIAMRVHLRPLTLLAQTIVALGMIVPVTLALVGTLFDPFDRVKFNHQGGVLETALLFIFWVILMRLFLVRRTIAFHLRKQTVDTRLPGALSLGSKPFVGALCLETVETRGGWQSTLTYGGLTIARTALLPSESDAKGRLFEFSHVLNQHLGLAQLSMRTVRCATPGTQRKHLR